jgi:ribokinase
MNKSHKPIVIVGRATMDLVTRTPRIPATGQTLIGTAFETTPGGKGANQAVAAARLGYPVHMVAMVGNDVYGPAIVENLARSGVCVEAIAVAPGSSGLAPMFVAENGENSIVVVPGANSKLTPDAVDRHAELIRSAGVVLCQLEIPLETVSHLLALCTRAGVPVMLDPAPAAHLPDEVWNQVAWFTPNETEAAFYLDGGQSPEQTAAHLLSRGLRAVALKRGAEGAFVATADGNSGWVAPFRVDAVDTVAAGDCFNGAFAVALLEGLDAFAAARFANAAAALCVTRKGAQASMPSRKDVESFLAGVDSVAVSR